MSLTYARCTGLILASHGLSIQTLGIWDRWTMPNIFLMDGPPARRLEFSDHPEVKDALDGPLEDLVQFQSHLSSSRGLLFLQ